jgi:hypothetical protein
LGILPSSEIAVPAPSRRQHATDADASHFGHHLRAILDPKARA